VPRSEIMNVEQLLKIPHDRGILCSIVALDGTGKTTFLKMVMEHIQERNTAVCIYDRFSESDRGSLDFLYRISSNLQNEIHPLKSRVNKIRGFLVKRPKVIDLGAQALKSIASPEISPFIQPATAIFSNMINSKGDDDNDSEIYDNFLKILNDFSKKLNQKLIILIDDIEVRNQPKLVSLLESLKKVLPPNVLILLSLSNNQIKSDRTIELTNFDFNQVRMYLVTNLNKKMREELISEIYFKSQGYPASLEWLRLNYNLDKNIESLLTRFQREGFLEQLKNNFLDNMLTSFSIEEKNILVICCALSVTLDNMLISYLSNVDNETSVKVLANFKERGILDIVNSQQLKNGILLDIYTVNPMIKNAIKTSYGLRPEINKKACKYYADSLLKQLYRDEIVVIMLMLKEFSASLPSSTSDVRPEALFDLLEPDPLKKLCVLLYIIDYYLISDNFNQLKNFTDAVPGITASLENKIFASAWNQYGELVKFLIADEVELKDKAIGIANEIESTLNHMPDNGAKKLLLFRTRTYKSAILSDNNDDSSVYTVIAAELGLPNDKLTRILLDIEGGTGVLKASHPDIAIEILRPAVKELRELSNDEKNEFTRRLDSLGTSFTFTDYRASAEFNLGMAYYNRSNKSFMLLDTIQNLTEATTFLKSSESNPVRGRYYKASKSLLDSFESYQTGLMLLSIGSSLESLQYIDKYLDTNLDSYAFANKGQALYNLKRYEKAIES